MDLDKITAFGAKSYAEGGEYRNPYSGDSFDAFERGWMQALKRGDPQRAHGHSPVEVGANSDTKTATVNRAILIGRLTSDPKIQTLENGQVICNLQLLTKERVRVRSTGEFRDTSEYHRIVLLRLLIDDLSEHLRQGMEIYVEGRLRTRKKFSEERQGQFVTEIVANRLKVL